MNWKDKKIDEPSSELVIWTRWKISGWPASESSNFFLRIQGFLFSCLRLDSSEIVFKRFFWKALISSKESSQPARDFIHFKIIEVRNYPWKIILLKLEICWKSVKRKQALTTNSSIHCDLLTFIPSYPFCSDLNTENGFRDE